MVRRENGANKLTTKPIPGSRGGACSTLPLHDFASGERRNFEVEKKRSHEGLGVMRQEENVEHL